MYEGLKRGEKLYLKVPSNVIRNEGIKLNSEEFLLYARLCYLYFKSFKSKEFEVNVSKMKDFLKFTDNRTFKNRLNKLNELSLIENEIVKLPKTYRLPIVFNDQFYKEQSSFTLISDEIFKVYFDEKINAHAFRLLMFYKSHINKSAGNDFCYAGYETIVARLKIGRTKIKEANEQLKKAGMIKIVKHKLEPTYEYDHDDELVYNRYNNHYYVAERLH